MKTISKSKLKARMLEIFREIEHSGEPMIVTDHGKPVIKIVSLQSSQDVQEVFSDVQGQVIYHEDIMRPTEDEWELT